MNTHQPPPFDASLKQPWVQLMPRHTPGKAPQWLHWCWQAAEQKKDPHQVTVLRNLAARADGDFEPKELAQWVENPSQQMRQVLALITLARGYPEVMPQAWPQGEAGTVARLRDELLLEAAKLASCITPGDPAPWLPERLRLAPQCQLPVLLLNVSKPQNPQGVVADLRLYRITQTGAQCRLLPAPTMVCTAQTQVFAQSLETVRQWLLAQCAGQSSSPALLDTALVWDLSPVDQPLGLIDGDSASAAMALGAAWLLREHMPPELRKELNVIQATDLFKTPVTAALQADGSLGPVWGVEWKQDSLHTVRQIFDRAGLSFPPLHIVQEQTGSKSQPLPTGVLWRPHASMLALAQWVAKSACPLNEGQQWLCDHLLNQNTARLDAQVHAAKLKQAAFPDQPVSHVLQYFLQRWAHWARAANGQVHSRFVPIQLKPETPGQQKKLAAYLDVDVPFKDLAELLDQLKDKDVAEAYLLRGVPGTGKTWLLRHYEMALCEQGVRACCQMLDGPAAPVVLPLYVPLNDMPGNADPVTWLCHTYVRQRGQFPHFDLLHQLLNSQPNANTRGYQVQWLLDGLNELKVDSAPAREQRAKQVVHNLWDHLLLPRLPLLLGTRMHQSYALTDMQRDSPFRVLPVDVQDWRDDDIQAYLHQRWPQAQPSATPDPKVAWQRLQSQPATRTMCSTPMLLDGLCELIESGLDTLPSDRASLFAAWLWQRLNRESKNSVLQDDRLLTPEARNLIGNPSRWQKVRLRTLPRQGVLLPSLFRQAEAQWRSASNLPATQRGGVAVAWSRAVSWLAPDVRATWAQAVQDLGLCEIDEDSNSFKFSHQLWGEFLASQSLLWGPVAPQAGQPGNWQPNPADWPTAELDALAEALRPPVLARQDAEELCHQQQTVQATWGAVPQVTWDKLLRDGLVWDRQTQPWSQALNTLYDTRGETNAKWWISFITSNHWLRVDAATDRARIDIKSMGDYFANKNVFSSIAEHWTIRADAWKSLLTNTLPSVFQRAAQAQLGTLAEALWQQQGRLPAPLAGDLDEVLVLAIQGLVDPLPWLKWLAQRGLWHTCALGVRGVLERMEGPQANAFLNLLRRCLLLHSVDAGPAAHAGVLASGCLDALDFAKPLNPQAHSDLHQLWMAQRTQAFGQHPTSGRDLRLRQQAALDLGHLGDTLRYQRSADGQALLLRPRHWVGVGIAGQDSLFRFGDEQGNDDEKPEFSHELPYFEMAVYPVTVAEYTAFIEADGYHPEKRWWQELGAAAQQWLKDSGRTQPHHWEDKLRNNPLQPVIGITWYEAMAYVAFASPAYADRRQDGLQLGLPTELLREAAVRGPWQPGQRRLRYPQGDEADPLAFNHLDTGLGTPSPVGIFSTAYSHLGLADAAGSSWEWCINAFSALHSDATSLSTLVAQNDSETLRALAGGTCNGSAFRCRVSYRNRNLPDSGRYLVGFRLCRVSQLHLAS